MLRFNLFPQMAVALLAIASSLAHADDRNRWVGKDDKGGRWTFRNVAGDSWSHYFPGGGPLDYTEAKRTDEYIELTCDIHTDNVVRNYKTKADFKSKETNGKWINMAKGEWRSPDYAQVPNSTQISRP
jgi:hypothetical protein